MTRIGYKKVELFFFLAFSLISIIPLCLVKYIPSLDGPQHLYTARLIAELIKGNEYISQFYRFNPIMVGNMSSLYIMGFLMLVFPAWLAEKIFLSLYIIGLALSFRYFIRSVQKTDSLLYLLIFPFAFTSLFMLGYYNFCVAFIPFFFALGYLKKNESGLGIRQAVILAVFCLLIYLSHAVVFVFFGMIIFLQMVFDLGYPVIIKSGDIKAWISTGKKYLIIMIAAIPAIVLWWLYFQGLSTNDRNLSTMSYRPVREVLEELYRLRILIGFHHHKEAGTNMLMFWSLAAIILSAFIPFHRYFPRHSQPPKRNNPDWLKWTFIALALFILAIFFPDRMVTGSMSARLCILFFFGLITWISLQSFPKIIMMIGLILIMGAFAWHRIIIFQFYQPINKDIADIENAGKFVKPKTIVYPIYCSESWFQQHFHCYLGVDKPLIDLNNPQANGPMPLIWNYTKMPNILLGKLNQTQAGVRWVSGNKYLPPVSADYVFIWKPQRKEAIEGVTLLLDKLNPYYNQGFISKNGNSLLLQLISDN